MVELKITAVIDTYEDLYTTDAKKSLYEEWADKLNVSFGTLNSFMSGQITYVGLAETD